MSYEERNAGWTPEQGCHGKRVYLSKHEAKVMSALISGKNTRAGGHKTHVYKCPLGLGGCGGYHVGHPIGMHSKGEAA